MASTPAFRAEHVGSLLRPQKLKDARVRLLGEDTPDTNIGPHGNADLATVEDSVVRELSDMQARVGLATATDGEVRRESYSNRVATALGGIDIDNPGTAIDRTGHPNPVPRIAGPIRRVRPIEADDVKFLRANTDRQINAAHRHHEGHPKCEDQ